MEGPSRQSSKNSLKSVPPRQKLIQEGSHVWPLRHCSRTHPSIQVDYHNYPYLLTEQIYDRRGKKSRFSEVEIWFLLYSLIRANGQACQINQQIVDLRPTNIFLNEDGKIRVSTNLSWPL